MKLTRNARLAAAVAMTGAAIMLPAVALASSGSAASQPAAHSRCLTANLRDWIGEPGDGAAGSTYYELEISNISGRSCTLYGFPGVSAVRDGHQLGSAASRSTIHRDSLVTLAPGATAHAILQISDVGEYEPSVCHPAEASALRVYAPGAYAPELIPFSVAGCAKHGPIFLHVTTTLPGTGIPGYST